jgi:hypothetical protein
MKPPLHRAPLTMQDMLIWHQRVWRFATPRQWVDLRGQSILTERRDAELMLELMQTRGPIGRILLRGRTRRAVLAFQGMYQP